MVVAFRNTLIISVHRLQISLKSIPVLAGFGLDNEQYIKLTFLKQYLSNRSVTDREENQVKQKEVIEINFNNAM